MKTDTKDKIVEYITSRTRATPHDLVRAFNISQVAIHKHLKELVAIGRVKKVGRSPLVFYLATDKKQMNTRGNNTLDQATRKKLVQVLKDHGATKAALFGSYSRNEAKEGSDIDILVELPKEQSLLDYVDLKLKLEETAGKKVDLVEYTAIKPKIRDHILQNQVQIL